MLPYEMRTKAWQRTQLFMKSALPGTKPLSPAACWIWAHGMRNETMRGPIIINAEKLFTVKEVGHGTYFET